MSKSAIEDEVKATTAQKGRRRRWDITQSLLYHLSFTSELITLREEMMLAEKCKLSLTDWRIMAVTFSFTPISSKDITRVTSMNKAAVSRGVARLEEQGLIQRAVDENDTRIHWLSLTAEGKGLFTHLRRSVESWSSPILDVLDEKEIQTLKEYLMRLRGRLGELTGEERAMSESFIFHAHT